MVISEAKQACNSSTHVLADRNEFVFGAMIEIPNDPTWMPCVIACAEAIRQAKQSLRLGKRKDRRGTFKTIAYGVSYGGGQRVSIFLFVCAVLWLMTDSVSRKSMPLATQQGSDGQAPKGQEHDTNGVVCKK